MIQYVWLIPLFPALAVLINAFLGHRLKERCHWLAVGSVGLSFLVATAVFIEVLGGHTGEVVLFDWITAWTFNVQFAFLVDQLSAVMLMVVTGVGFLIHLYAVGYMHDDPGYFRFFTYLNLFMVSMLILVLGNSFALMFIGWEGVGLCSYLLIGYYYTKRSATTAGNKAFIVNRIGDAGFLMGIFTIYTAFGTLQYSEVLPHATEISTGVATVITMALFVGAMGKSAQIPLYVWLPDAMEGPTPVSALIHAATMVTAGVYMVCRASALYMQAPASLAVVAVVGAATAIFSASIGLVQNDFKRVLAYSTVSQLGYMFLACGVGAFAAGIFHLMTHAFFKALLFGASSTPCTTRATSRSWVVSRSTCPGPTGPSWLHALPYRGFPVSRAFSPRTRSSGRPSPAPTATGPCGWWGL
jgi:NADH-quinone oxidoreductase subunit L